VRRKRKEKWKEKDRKGARTRGETEGARYGVATMSRRLKIVGLFCKRAL